MASANQAGSSSEETSTSSDETYVEVIAALCKPRTLPEARLGLRTPAGLSPLSKFQDGLELERLRPGEGNRRSLSSHRRYGKRLGLWGAMLSGL